MTTSTNPEAAQALTIDEPWLSAPRARSRLRLTLIILLAAALCFWGGILAQKHLGVSPAAATTPGAGLAGGLPSGFPGAAGGAIPSTSGGLPGSGTSSPGGAATANQSEVVGTVVRRDGSSWIVKDLGGKRHRVRVSDDATVTRERTLDPGDVAVGDQVDITGDLARGQLTADAVTLR